MVDLIEARRMDEERLKNLNKKHLLEIADNYRSRAVMNLINVLGNIMNNSNIKVIFNRYDKSKISKQTKIREILAWFNLR